MFPAIAISYTHPAAETDFVEFQAKFAGGPEVVVELREGGESYAALEWLIPTAVVVFIGKAYIDGFVKEIGKDHYILLKEALRTLYRRLVGPEALIITVVSSAGKSRTANKYSLLFSLLAEAPDGVRLKLLIRQAATESEYSDAVRSYLVFVEQFNAGTLSAELLPSFVRHGR